MKKLKFNRLLLLVAPLILSSCNMGGGKAPAGDLSIMVYSAGYGMGWVDEAVRIYNEDHPGVKVVSSGNSAAFETIKTKLENHNCEYDVILVANEYYANFVSNGYLEDLSDVYTSTIPDNTKKIEEVVNKQIADSITVDNKIYGIPWQQNTGSGLIYNVDMFEKYGWELPTTLDELWELCDQIDTDTKGRVTPISFGGVDGHGYMDYNFSQWLCQYYGYDNMIEYFKLKSPEESFGVQEEGRTKIYQTIAKITNGLTKNGNRISLKGAIGADSSTAQTNFVEGKTAMDICGCWFKTEMASYMKMVSFNAGYCPMPHINTDKKSGDGKIDTSDIRFSTPGNLMAIPETSKRKELAKDFLKYMFTKKSYTSFVKSNNGLIRPFEGMEVDTSTFDSFTKAAYEYWSGNGNAKTVYMVSANSIMERGILSMFMAHRGAFFGEIGKANATYEQSLAVANKCFASEMTSVSEHYDAKTKTWY